MKFKTKLSRTLICLGILCVGYALVLFYQNEKIENHAKTYSDNAIAEIQSIVEKSEELDYNNKIEEPKLDSGFSIDNLPEFLVGEETYVGILTIPSINVEVPIQNDWSYQKLFDTPCVYKGNPMSIAAHNYNSHFGKLVELEIGAQVLITNGTGEKFLFAVESVEKIPETDVEKLEDENFDLSLFTCEKTNNSVRILVRLNEVK